MKKRLLPMAAMLLTVFFATVWLQTAGQPTVPVPTHTLRVALWDYGVVGYDKEIISRFMAEYPDIKIEVVSYPPAYYDDSLEAMLNSGERLDVIYANQLAQFSMLAARGVPLPLDDLAARDGIDLSSYPDTEVLCDPQTGALSGLPYREDKFMLYYNKDLFDRAGVPYPQPGMTWQQYHETAHTLTERLQAEDPALWGAYFLNKERHMFYYMSAQPFDWADDPFSLAAPGLSLLLQMERDGSIPPFSLAEGRSDSQRLFETGRYAMYVHGSWFMNFLSADQQAGLVNFNWGVTERPVWSADTPNQNDAWLTPLCINRSTTEPEAAWTFVKYVCGAKGAETLAQDLMLPAYHSPQIDETLRQRLTQSGIDPALFLDGLSAPAPPLSAREQTLSDAVYAQYSRALLSLDTVEESIAQMETLRETLP